MNKRTFTLQVLVLAAGIFLAGCPEAVITDTREPLTGSVYIDNGLPK